MRHNEVKMTLSGHLAINEARIPIHQAPHYTHDYMHYNTVPLKKKKKKKESQAIQGMTSFMDHNYP